MALWPAGRARRRWGGRSSTPRRTVTLSAPAWAAYSPVLLVLAIIAVAANASAILRLRAVACAISPEPAVARVRKEAPRESTLRDVIVGADAVE